MIFYQQFQHLLIKEGHIGESMCLKVLSFYIKSNLNEYRINKAKSFTCILARVYIFFLTRVIRIWQKGDFSQPLPPPTHSHRGVSCFVRLGCATHDDDTGTNLMQNAQGDAWYEGTCLVSNYSSLLFAQTYID